MVTFRNNNSRRNNFRRNDRNFKSNGERTKFVPNYTNNENFQRKIPGRNNHNASKLIEKYNNLAREALSVNDKILSENYFQHADHFTRILNDQENYKKSKIQQNLPSDKTDQSVVNDEKKNDISENNLNEISLESETEIKNQFNPIIFSDFKTSNFIF